MISIKQITISWLLPASLPMGILGRWDCNDDDGDCFAGAPQPVRRKPAVWRYDVTSSEEDCNGTGSSNEESSDSASGSEQGEQSEESLHGGQKQLNLFVCR